MLDLTQLLRVPQVDHLFDISPDGSKFAFAWNKTGDWQIYEMGLGGIFLPSQGSRTALSLVPENSSGFVTQPLTSGPGGKFNPRYSPNGTKLAYALDMDGSESYHLVVYDPSANTHTDLTPNISHALQPNFCWSPDGRQLAFLNNEQGHFSMYVTPVRGGKPQLVLNTGHPAWQVEWSPDGRHLAVSCEMYGQDYGIFIVNLHTKETIELPLNAHEPKWSPDGRLLAFHSDNYDWFDVGIYDLSTKEIEWVSQSRGDSQTPIFISDVASEMPKLQLAYTQSTGAVNWIEVCKISTLRAQCQSQETLLQNDSKKYQIGQGIHNGIRLTSNMKRLVTTFSSPGQPTDLWMIDLESGKSIQLTNSLPAELSEAEFVTP